MHKYFCFTYIISRGYIISQPFIIAVEEKTGTSYAVDHNLPLPTVVNQYQVLNFSLWFDVHRRNSTLSEKQETESKLPQQKKRIFLLIEV